MKIPPSVFFGCTYDIHRLQRVMNFTKSIPGWTPEEKQQANIDCGLRSVFLHRLAHEPGFHQYVLKQVSEDAELFEKTDKYLIQLKAEWVDSFEAYYFQDAAAPNDDVSNPALSHISYRNYEDEYDYSLSGYIPFNPHLNISSISGETDMEINQALAYLKNREHSWKDHDLIPFFSLINAEDRDAGFQLKYEWREFLHKNIARSWIYALDEYHSDPKDDIAADNAARTDKQDTKRPPNNYDFKWAGYMPFLNNIRDAAAERFGLEIPEESWLNSLYAYGWRGSDSDKPSFEHEIYLCLAYLRFTTAYLTIAAEFWFQKHADKTALINRRCIFEPDVSVFDKRPLVIVKTSPLLLWDLQYPKETKNLYLYAINHMLDDDPDRYYFLRQLGDLSELLHEEKEAEYWYAKLHAFLEQPYQNEEYWEYVRDHCSICPIEPDVTTFLPNLYAAESREEFEALLLEIEEMPPYIMVYQLGCAHRVCLRSLLYVARRKGITDIIEKSEAILTKNKENTRYRIYENFYPISYFEPYLIRQCTKSNTCEILVGFLETIYKDREYMDEKIKANIQCSMILGYFHLRKYSDVCRVYAEIDPKYYYYWDELLPAVYLSYLECGENEMADSCLTKCLKAALQSKKSVQYFLKLQILLEELAFADCDKPEHPRRYEFIKIMDILDKDTAVTISYLFTEYCILTGCLREGLEWFNRMIPKTEGTAKAELFLRKGKLLYAKGSRDPAMKSLRQAKFLLQKDDAGYPSENYSELYREMAQIYQDRMDLSAARACLKSAFRWAYDDYNKKSGYSPRDHTLWHLNPKQRSMVTVLAVAIAELDTYLENHVNTAVMDDCPNARKAIDAAEYESLYLYRNITDEEFDFSGPIMKYAKALENMLQEKIWSHVVDGVHTTYPVDHPAVNKEELGWWLYSTLSPDRLTLSLGNWAKLDMSLLEYETDHDTKPENSVLRLVVSQLVKILPKEKLDTLIKICSDVYDLRNEIAHGSVLTRPEYLDAREKFVSYLNRVIVLLWGGEDPNERTVEERKAECTFLKEVGEFLHNFSHRPYLALECLKRAYKSNPTDTHVHVLVKILCDYPTDTISINLIRKENVSKQELNSLHVYQKERDDFMLRSGPVVMGLYSPAINALYEQDYFKAQMLFRQISDYLKYHAEFKSEFDLFVPEYMENVQKCNTEITHAKSKIRDLKNSSETEDRKRLGICYYHIGNYAESCRILNEVCSKGGADSEIERFISLASKANDQKLRELSKK